MSEFHVRVVKLGSITKHPNADTLSVTNVEGYPVIIRTGDFSEGDKAVYVSVDAVVPKEPRWEFLGDSLRIKAKKLRGIFSMGILTQANPEWEVGQNVQKELNIEKYEPAPPENPELNELDLGYMPVYTDVEGLRRWSHLLIPGEEVFITEKIHGENFRATYKNDRLYVGSRTNVKKDISVSQFWKSAHHANLVAKLSTTTDIVVYGETFGHTGGFPYGTKPGYPNVLIFDALNAKTKSYLDVDNFLELMNQHKLATAPILYRGPWSEDLRHLADGKSTLDPSHIREGIVVRPVKERFSEEIGRVILKLHGEAFLLRKGH